MLIELVTWARGIRDRIDDKINLSQDLVYLTCFLGAIREELQERLGGEVLAQTREQLHSAVDEITDLEAELQRYKDREIVRVLQGPDPDVRVLRHRLEAAERMDDMLAQELLDARRKKAEGLDRERALREHIDTLEATIALSTDVDYMTELGALVSRLGGSLPERSDRHDTIVPPAAEEGAA